MVRRAARLAAVLGLLLWPAAGTAPAQALNDPEYDRRQWGMQLIGAKAAWDAGILGHGVRIAVLDTGVHRMHQDLAGRVQDGPNFIEPGKPPQDDGRNDLGQPQGHGTHVAGIAGATIDNGGVVGVAPGATIVAVKVLDSEGSGSYQGVAAAIRWAADQRIEVINLSLGDTSQSLFGPATEEAIAYAWSKGSICVFAAGNDFVLPSGFADEPAIVVSSTSRRDTESDYSNGVGAARWGMAAPGGAESAVTSPVEDDIFSTAWENDSATNTYRYLAGTSMAAPHVSGAAALLRSAGLTPQQTVDRLLATAKDLGPAGRDSTFGHGRLDVAKAVAGLGGAGSGGSGGGGPTATSAAGAPSPSTTTTRATTATTRRSAPAAGTAPAPAATAPAPAAGTTPPPTAAATDVSIAPPATDRPAEAAASPPRRPGPGDGGEGGGLSPWLPAGIAATALGTVGWIAYGRRHLLRGGGSDA